jgi:FkbM family methyltransferase
MKIFADPTDQVIAPQLVEFGVWERGLTALVRKRVRQGTTFIDVGANIGYYTLLAAKLVGPFGRVIAFEPEPGVFELMKRGVEANGFRQGVYLERKALSNKRGILELYLSSTNRGENSIVPTRGESRISVPAVTLDEYLGSGHHVDFIKMDIEGGEGFALEGMQQTLRSNPNIDIAMELSPWSLEHAGYTPMHLLDLLREDGFIAHIIDEESGALTRVSLDALLQTYARSGNDRELHWDLWLSRHPGSSGLAFAH